MNQCSTPVFPNPVKHRQRTEPRQLTPVTFPVSYLKPTHIISRNTYLVGQALSVSRQANESIGQKDVPIGEE